jgi:hypothetical protein
MNFPYARPTDERFARLSGLAMILAVLAVMGSALVV